jgi:hypothetical protein
MYAVGSNFYHHAQDPIADIAKRLYVNSVDYSSHVRKWPSISRDWNSVRAANVSIQLSNTDRLFNFFTGDKTRLKDSVDLDYGVRYKSHNLLRWSHVYTATVWSKVRIAVLPDAIANPINGEIDATKLLTSADSNTHYVSQIFSPSLLGSGDALWATGQVKPAESLSLYVEVSNGGAFPAIQFDVESGTVQSASSNFLDYFLRQNTNGWYDYGAKFIPSSLTGQISTELMPMDPSSKAQLAHTGNGSEGLYVYANQIQYDKYRESDRYFMTAADEQKPFGMNLGTFTQVYSGNEWAQSASIFVTNNATTAPDGSATASVIQNSDNAVAGLIRHTLTLTEEEQDAEDYYCIANWFMRQDSAYTRMIAATFNVDSPNLIGHEVIYNWDQNSVTTNQQYRPGVSSGMSWISAGGADNYRGDWIRIWATFRKPRTHEYFPGALDTIRGFFYPSVTPNSGTVASWGYSLQKGGAELLNGPGPYVAVHSDVSVYPSNAEDVIDLFDGTTRDANYSRGRLKLQAKDKLRNLSERIVGTGEVPVQINSITPSWLLFTLCSCYGGMSSIESTNNVDIDWAAVDSWDSHNTSNNVYVKTDFRGIKVTEALKRLSRMSRVAVFLEENRVTIRRWVNVDTNIQAVGDTEILSNQLSVNDESMVNRQWIFGDYDQSSEYFQIALFDEDTASQNSYGLHERVIKDQAIFYVTSVAALDTAQRIVTNEAEPIDRLSVTGIPSMLQMQIGESLSVTDNELEIAGTYRIMASKIDMDKDRVTFQVDNSQLLLANPFILDTSSLGGTDVLT